MTIFKSFVNVDILTFVDINCLLYIHFGFFRDKFKCDLIACFNVIFGDNERTKYRIPFW